jgi:hypothetical protein
MQNSRKRTKVPKDETGSRPNLKRKLPPISGTNAKRKRNDWSVTHTSDPSNKRVTSRSGRKRSALSCQKKQKSVTRVSRKTSKDTKSDEGKFVKNSTKRRKQAKNSSLKSFESQTNSPDNKEELTSKTVKEEAVKMELKTENVEELPSDTCDDSRASTDTSTQPQQQGSCKVGQLAERLKCKMVQSFQRIL